MPNDSSAAMGAFESASNMAPADIRDLVVTLTMVLVFWWSAYYIRRVLAHGWNVMDMMHIGTGLLLVVCLTFFVFWMLAEYGAGI